MNIRFFPPILAAALAAGCVSRPFVASLDTGLPPGNASDVAIAPDGRFAAALNGPDRSLTVFAVADERDRVRLGEFSRVAPSTVDLADGGTPERLAFGPGIAHGEAIHVLVRDADASGASVRRVRVSGHSRRMSLGTDEVLVADPEADDIVEHFADPNPPTEDELLRIREEVRRMLESSEPVFAGTDAIAAAAAWNRGDRRFVFATLRGGDSTLAFDATNRGQATLLSVLPCGAPRGLAVDAERGILYVADERGARIVAFDLRSRRAGLR